MKRRLWDIRSVGEVIRDLLDWGHGSGEEVFDYLTQHGVSAQEARSLIDVLAKTQTTEAI